jgi:hypothetical protein
MLDVDDIADIGVDVGFQGGNFAVDRLLPKL